MSQRITEQDLDKIRQWFGSDLESLTEETFASIQKAARKKFHPDNFAHLGDDAVMEMAKERFQELEKLGAKVKQFVASKAQTPDPEEQARYTSDGMAIDIMTQDKTLKFVLFGSAVIYEGDVVKIPGTTAKLVALDDYLPRIAMGFRDNIKVHLTFGPDDNLQEVVHWLFRHINGRISSFVIEGKIVAVEPLEILRAIRKEARKELGPSQES